MRSSGRSARRRQVPPARGDEGELLRRHSASLERAIARMAPWAPPWLIEEGCGHAWEQLVRHQPERTSVFAWLRVVAYHEVLRLNRKKVNERSLEAELTIGDGNERVSILDRLPGLAEPRDTELQLEARDALRLVAGLRWRRRRVIELRLAGYSYNEIARKLGVTYTHVNRHLSKGRAELRKLREAA